ncbi:POTE ankyrin domain family member A-like [Peromyscus eremicus]|uniref:POTE ankyrin domain family member A-like n=1 Tax=Peromyscus eremicus TaxID=42410 RepID=UPI0027DBB8EB|nr:POTE ankyrin domain family member A-like [Peromyscus eremicus]
MGGRMPQGTQGFSGLCKCQKKNLEETPLGFCDIKAPRNTPCFGTQNPAYLDMAYFPDNDLHMAACAGDLPFVRLYLSLGKYEVNHRDKENRSVLHFACFYGYLDLVKYLWRRGCEINTCDNHDITPLMKAVQSWEEEIVCFLLEHHANLHIKDSNGNTALHYAVYGGEPALAARLLQYGANIEERTKRCNSKDTVCRSCSRCSCSSKPQLVINSSSCPTVARSFSWNLKRLQHQEGRSSGERNNYRRLLRKKLLDPISRTIIQDNLTPLLLALREDRLKMAEYLVRMKASVHAVDFQRRTSLMYAVRCDSSVMVNLLLQQGVDMNFKDFFGWTALRYAIEGDREVRTILLEYERNLKQSLREKKNSG